MTDYIRTTPEGHIRVTSASPFDYIVSYVPFQDINKMVGDPIALPNTATVTRKSSKIETLIVNWEPASTEVAGTFYISGSIGNGAGVVTQKLIVTLKKKIVSYVNFLDVTVKQYEDTAFRMPMTAYVTYNDGTDGTADIVWGAHSTDVAGSFDIPGIATDAEGLTIDVTVKLVVTALTDLDILRQIRDANPTSQLPALWSEDKDPYTEWEGVTWGTGNLNVIELEIIYLSIACLENVNKLTRLTYLNFSTNNVYSIDVTGLVNLEELTCDRNFISSLNVSTLVNLTTLSCNNNDIETLDVTTLVNLTDLKCQLNVLSELILNDIHNLNIFLIRGNLLAGLPTLTSNGDITTYNFTLNNFSPSELDRFRAMGFTDESKLLPQNP